MSEINILNEKELEEYQSQIFIYKRALKEIDILEEEKKPIPTVWFGWELLGILSFWAIMIITGKLLFSIMGGFGLFLTAAIVVFFIIKGDIFSNYLEQIFTLGKIEETKTFNEKTDKKIEELKIELKSTKEQIENFEQEIVNYYQKYLENFFLENLYKKRFNSPKFNESLSNFSLMVREVKMVNKALIFERCHLKKYEDYLFSKQLNLLLQEQSTEINKDLNKGYITPLGEKISKIIKDNPEIQQIVPYVEKIISPETVYRVARKIDWNKVNEQRGLTGSKGEKIAMALEINYLTQIGNLDLAEKVKHVSEELGDGLGYDILSYFPDGREKYIEVKSTTKTTGQSFHISSNELNFLKENIDTAVIYRIFSVNDENTSYSFFSANDYDKDSSLQILSAEMVLNSQITPTDYLIKL